MKIEVGTTYNVCNKWKKSYEEIEYYLHEDGRVVSVSTLWRSGNVNITPVNEDEVEALEEAIADDEYVFEPYAFEEFEFCDSWDGVSEDLNFITDKWTEEQKDAITEAHEEGEDFINDILENLEFYPDDNEVFIHNGILVEVFEGY